tara:strand:- start:46656 stop:47648 length:993 start_codon:yes stop_codon:yes gene_type:complete
MRSILVFLLLAPTLFACGGSNGLRLKRIDSSVQKPSNIAVYFTVETADGAPVAGLQADSFQIYEDGKLVSVHESKQTILNPEVATEHLTLLLVDMSGSVTESDDVPTIVAGASSFAERLGQYQKVAIYAFDGRKEIVPISDFSASSGRVANAAEKLDGFHSKDPSTNLNGAVIEALEVLDKKLARSKMPLRFGTLVVFTDGSDRASRVPKKELQEALDATEHEVYVIGVGAEIDDDELHEIGFTGVVIQPKREEISKAFEETAKRIATMSQRYYLLGYCSPARAGEHRVEVVAKGEGKSGSLSYEFSAEGFRPDCNPEKKPNFSLTQPSE